MRAVSGSREQRIAETKAPPMGRPLFPSCLAHLDTAAAAAVGAVLRCGHK